MATSDDLPVDAAFDAAFDHLAATRIAYEDDPRDPDRFRQLADARAALEDARVRMNGERRRLGLEPRQVTLPPMPHVDIDQDRGPRHEWQTIQGEG